MAPSRASVESKMKYHQVRTISGRGTGDGQFAEALRGIALDVSDRIYAAGDTKLAVFSGEGKTLKGWPTGLPGYSVVMAADGTVYVGEEGQVELFDGSGKLLDTWRDAQRLGLVSALGLTGDSVLCADVAGRCIRRFDRRGKFLNDIGKDNKMQGFLLPNRHLDLAVDPQGVIHAANPGKHRVERYTVEGKLLGHFGRFDGRDPAGFGGCCNPTNLALTPAGQIVVTEKAGPRVKVYDADGKVLAVFGETDFELNCKNMDVAVDSRGRLYVIDTVRLHICVYAADEDATSAPATRPAVKEARP